MTVQHPPRERRGDPRHHRSEPRHDHQVDLVVAQHLHQPVRVPSAVERSPPLGTFDQFGRGAVLLGHVERTAGAIGDHDHDGERVGQDRIE
jgi:hypothetical protein